MVVSDGHFDNTSQLVTFTTSINSTEVRPFVSVVDDGINEPEEQFVVIVKLVNSSLTTGVKFTSPSTLIRIVDNDGKHVIDV